MYGLQVIFVFKCLNEIRILVLIRNTSTVNYNSYTKTKTFKRNKQLNTISDPLKV